MKKLIHAILMKSDGSGHLTDASHHKAKITDQCCAATITARYFKGISSNGDNMVIVVSENER